jgi:hypothetical protein
MYKKRTAEAIGDSFVHWIKFYPCKKYVKYDRIGDDKDIAHDHNAPPPMGPIARPIAAVD